MLKKWQVGATAVIILLAMVCVGPVRAEVVGQTDAEVQAAVEPMVENLLAGFNDGNYQKYSRDFDPMLKESLPEEKFREVRTDILNKIGRYQSRQYLGFLNQNRFTAALWKGKFDKTASDVLIKLVTSKRQDKVVIVGLWFQ